jgi:hypothetical protein
MEAARHTETVTMLQIAGVNLLNDGKISGLKPPAKT